MQTCLLGVLISGERVAYGLTGFWPGKLADFGGKPPSDLVGGFAQYLCIFGQSLVQEHSPNLYINSIIFLFRHDQYPEQRASDL